MKIRTTLILSILLSALVLLPAVNAKKRGGGRGEAEDHRRKALQFIDAKQFDKAVEEFTKEVEAAPDNPEAYRDRGTAYRAAGRAAIAANGGAAAAERFKPSVGEIYTKIRIA